MFEIEFRTKMTASACVYLPLGGARGLERLRQLKYYVVLKLQITINLGLNAARNAHHIEKTLQIKVIQFGTTFN